LRWSIWYIEERGVGQEFVDVIGLWWGFFHISPDTRLYEQEEELPTTKRSAIERAAKGIERTRKRMMCCVIS
jgi:hypothetical protein